MGPGPVCGLSPLDKPPHRPDHSQHQHHHDLQSASIGLWRGDYQPRSEYQVLGGYAEKNKNLHAFQLLFIIINTILITIFIRIFEVMASKLLESWILSTVSHFQLIQPTHRHFFYF